MKLIASNKASEYNYFLSNDLEVGFSLTSLELKSLLENKISLKESRVQLIKNELFLLNANITPNNNVRHYDNYDALRPKKLLLHRKQIKKFIKLLESDSSTLMIKNIYVSDRGLVKGTLCLGIGKKKYDKREVIKKRDNELYNKRHTD